MIVKAYRTNRDNTERTEILSAAEGVSVVPCRISAETCRLLVMIEHRAEDGKYEGSTHIEIDGFTPLAFASLGAETVEAGLRAMRAGGQE